MTKQEKQLWTQYNKARTTGNRNVLAEHYYKMLPGIIGACCPRKVGLSVTEDDVSAAVIGLLRSIESYHRQHSASFITYLRNAIVRSVMNDRARAPAIGQTGRLERGQSCPTTPIDGLDFAAPERMPDIERREELQRMTSAILRSKRHVDTIIATFNPQERRVLQLMHFEGMTGKECACRLKLSQGRVSQIRKAAFAKLRKALEV